MSKIKKKSYIHIKFLIHSLILMIVIKMYIKSFFLLRVDN